MARMVDADDLICAAEIADLLAVTKPAVSNYQKRYPDFPAPVVTTPSGRVRLWSLAAVREWAAARAQGDVERTNERITALRAELARLEGIAAFHAVEGETSTEGNPA